MEWYVLTKKMNIHGYYYPPTRTGTPISILQEKKEQQINSKGTLVHFYPQERGSDSILLLFYIQKVFGYLGLPNALKIVQKNKKYMFYLTCIKEMSSIYITRTKFKDLRDTKND